MEYRSAHILLSQKVKVYILTLLAIHWIAVVATGATEVLLPKAPFLPSQTNGPLAQMTTDDATQLETLRRMADAGVAPAQFALGYILESGKLLPSDSVEALKWYRAAAIGGDASAQYALGRAYFDGISLPQDRVEGVRWLKLAAARNVMEAQYAMAFALAKGLGIERDQALAIQWYRKAAEQGMQEAQLALGRALAAGDGVAREEFEACKWLLISSQGDEDALTQVSPTLGRGFTNEQRLTVKRLASEFIPKPQRWTAPPP
jgi:TPR repeat protein